MQYFDTDYYTLITLQRLERSGATTVENLLRESTRELGWMACADNMASILSALAADGYITVEANEHMPLRADTSVNITEKGKAPLKISGIAKLFSGMRDRAIRKNEKAFCALPRPAVRPFLLDRASFVDYATSVEQDREVAFFMVDNAEDGLYTLSLRHPYYRATDMDEPDAGDLSLLCDDDGLHRMLMDLLNTALYFTENRKARKITLYSPGKAFVMTFCEVADETGETYMRVTVAPILFNRQRFIGKRDGELDYAQCGDNVLSTGFDSTEELCDVILGAVSQRTDLLDDALSQKIHELYAKIR